MKTALVAGLAVVALLGVGVVAASAAMRPGGMGGSAGGMMGGGMMGGGMGGMHNGDMQGMHDQMHQGMDPGGMHDQCPCCDGDEDPST